VRIGLDKHQGHERIISCTIACVVLHNILHGMQNENDQSWLGDIIEERERDPEPGDNELGEEQEVNTEAKKVAMNSVTV